MPQEPGNCPRCDGTGKVVAGHVQDCGLCLGERDVPKPVAAAYEYGKRIGRNIGAAETKRAITRAIEAALTESDPRP